MWSTNSLWFEVAIVSTIFAVGNIVFGHFEELTPKWRRVLKFILFLVVVCLLSYFLNRYVAFGFLGVGFLAVIYVHGYILPKKGINGLTGEPREKYYEFRGWRNKDSGKAS
jgi:hypothetical protein